MGRVEKFKELRNLRNKYLFSVFLFLLLLTAGICTADYSINGLMGGQRGLDIIVFKNNNSYLEIKFMNQKIYLNTQYVSRDLDRLRQEVKKLLGV